MQFSPVTDLNCSSSVRHASSLNSRLEQSVDVHRKTCFLAGNGSPASAYLSSLCSTLRRQPRYKTLHVPRSVPLYGIRSADLSGKPVRYRSLPQSTEQQALPYGHTLQSCTQHTGRCNENRDWRIYADFAQSLIQTARRLYADEDLGLELDNTVYALDATTIDLCLSVFPWAHFRQTKAAVKLYTLLDLRGNIPSFRASEKINYPKSGADYGPRMF